MHIILLIEILLVLAYDFIYGFHGWDSITEKMMRKMTTLILKLIITMLETMITKLFLDIMGCFAH